MAPKVTLVPAGGLTPARTASDLIKSTLGETGLIIIKLLLLHEASVLGLVRNEQRRDSLAGNNLL